MKQFEHIITHNILWSAFSYLKYTQCELINIYNYYYEHSV
jgi:hypothetical protein